MKYLLITIDGPAGAGKTTVSRGLAQSLGYRYIDTGALYRGVAFQAKSHGIRHDDDKGLEYLCSILDIKFVSGKDGTRLIVNDLDITDQIRTPEITMLASAVSARSVVRKCLLDLQKEIGKEKGVVFEGRDMGTVVFPDADVKFYLDASCKTRAMRRYKELSSKNSVTLEEIERDIKDRDKNDSTRVLAPLKPAKDAVIVDSTDLSVKEVIELMLIHIPNILRER
ncbi:MAG: (d)CMP kinase [Deltaproteobacteria bacterium]|nr:(d)CMP kinase [Deltaproteobacteria bacterium]MBW2660676.1 (d)CMP kinase [Deltaproteobacteria bacterium]